jgi:hypothetical protein
VPDDWRADAAEKLDRLALYADRRVAAAVKARQASRLVLSTIIDSKTAKRSAATNHRTLESLDI